MSTNIKLLISRLPQWLFFALIVRPLVLIVLGLNVRGRVHLPLSGPAIIAANHNSHLDTLVLMSLFPLSRLHQIRPVAAADYFFKSRWLKWFSLHCIGIIPLNRQGFKSTESLFAQCRQALEANQILIIFPEGSRGQPEQLSQLKKGIFHLQRQASRNVPIIPLLLRGLGKSLPKGEALFVPYNCDVIIGEALPEMPTADNMIHELQSTYEMLSTHCLTK